MDREKEGPFCLHGTINLFYFTFVAWEANSLKLNFLPAFTMQKGLEYVIPGFF